MSAWRSPRTEAIRSMRKQVMPATVDEDRGASAVDLVFEHLREPDRDMLDAGMRELKPALPPGAKAAYQRNLARAIWLAMLEAAR